MLKGDASSNLLLRSTTDGAYWYLSVTGTVVQSLDYVDVKDSNAGVGYGRPVTVTHYVDSGHNTNWVFSEVGLTNTWIGTSNTSWSVPTNWNLGRPPIDSDVMVFIPSGKPHYPVLDTDRIFPALTIENGGSLFLNGYNLNLLSNAAIAGALAAAGTETITFLQDVDFTGGTFTQAQSTVIIGGTNAQTVTSGGQLFHRLTVTNSTAAVTFVDAVRAVQFRGFSASINYGNDVNAGDFWVYSDLGAVTQTFASGSAYTMSNLYFTGGPGKIQYLRSSGAGAWLLNVSNLVYAKYVDVQNSDASGGQTVHALSSVDGGGNPNWVFDDDWKVWTGSVSTSFTNDNNWSPVGAPTATSFVLIDDPHPARISLPATVYRLVLGGSTQATLEANVPLTVLEDVQVLAGGVLTHSGNTTTPINRLNVALTGNLTLAVGGSITANGKGYASGYGPGAPEFSPTSSNKRSGAGHGGRGSLGGDLVEPGNTYGSVIAPTNLGSGGSSQSISPGGGAVLLSVGGSTRVDGLIEANGANQNVNANGAGAGGSVSLTTSNLLGSGTIQANGGPGYNNNGSSGSGGGGRVAVVLTGADDVGSVTVRALGGANGSLTGAGGTVYTRTRHQGPNEGTLLVANNGADANRNTDISSFVTDASVGDVIIRNGGELQLNTNQSLTVNGSFSNGNVFVTQLGSTLFLASTNASTVYGQQTIANLVSTNWNKTIRFEAGRTNTVEEGLRLQGDGVNKLVLRSSQEDLPWYLSVSPTAVPSVQDVDVKDSHAEAGYGTLIAATTSTDAGGNVNWTFAALGLTNTWIGTVDTEWTTPDNWDQGRAPIPGDVAVVISNGCAFYPVLATDHTVANFVMLNGSAFNLNGQNLTVTGGATLGGTLAAAGAETVTFQGNVDLTGGAFVPAQSTVILNGSAAQSVVSDGERFHILIVSNLSGAMTFADAMAADHYRSASASVTYDGNVAAVDFRVESDGGSVTQTFAAGSTSTIQNLYLLGSAGKIQYLRSAGAWALNVSDVALVRHVDVAGSDASGGDTIRAINSFDSGGNTNWSFDTVWKTWTGAVNTDFLNAGNWSPTGAPSATDFVLIDSTNLAVLGAPTTVYRLVLGGSTTATLRANALLTVNEDLQVLPGGTLTHAVNTTAETYKLNVAVLSNLTVAAGGRIGADSVGRQGDSGIGAGTDYAGGGSYGGQGGYGRDAGQPPGPTYGSIVAPTNLGSGGASYSTGVGGNGGGAVRLAVGGTTRIDGTVSATGQSTTTRWAGGGSGGSLWITAANLLGSGTISANGGNATYEFDGVSGGGGGRIAAYLTGSDDFGNVSWQAYGGSGTRAYGAAGTVYLQGQSDASERGRLRVDNGGHATSLGEYTDLSGVTPASLTPRELVLGNGAVLALGADSTLTLTNLVLVGDATSGRPGIRVRGGQFLVPASFAFSSIFLAIDTAGSVFSPETSLVVESGSVLELNVPHALTGAVTLAAGGTMQHRDNTSSSEAHKIDLTVVGDLTVATGATINVNARGFTSPYGPGVTDRYRSGGSYGGKGAQGMLSAGSPGNTYGSVVAPTNLGSAGGTIGENDGGGAVLLRVTGATTVDGVIAANGTNSNIGGNSGGSGGTVSLTTATLAGSGTIQADGGRAWNIDSGAGGGGRVAVILTGSDDFDAVVMQARGGANGSDSGGAGTVYRQGASQAGGRGTVTVDNNGMTLNGYTELPGELHPGLSNELKRATLVLTNTNTRLALTTDAEVGNLVLYTTNASCLTLGSWDLTVNVSEHPLSSLVGRGPGATNRVDHYTQILWNPKRGTVYGFR
jgi:hypothetical protein